MSPRAKKILLRLVFGGVGFVLLGAALTAGVVASLVSREYGPALATLFPDGAVAYAECEDLAGKGERLLAAWDEVEKSRLFEGIALDPRLREARIREALARVRREIPEALSGTKIPAIAPEGLDLLQDLAGRETAVAVYVREAAPEAGPPAPGASPPAPGASPPAAGDVAPGGATPPVPEAAPPVPQADVLLATRVSRRLRLAGLLLPLVPASALPPDLRIAKEGVVWRVAAPPSPPAFVAFEKDVVILGTSAERVAAAVALAAGAASAAAPGGLVADPRFAAGERAEPRGGEPLRLFLDMDRLDRLWGWRAKASVPYPPWPLNLLAAAINAYQDEMFEPSLVTAAFGSLALDAGGELRARASVVTDPARRRGPVVARPAPAPPAALEIAPAGIAAYTTLRTSARDVWERLMSGAEDEARKNLRVNMPHYQDVLDRIFPLLRDHVTFIVGAAHPPEGGSPPPPIPPVALAIACDDPDAVYRAANDIFERYRKRLLDRDPNFRLPDFPTMAVHGGRLIWARMDQLPSGLESFGPRFSPGVLFIGSSIVIFSERDFAVQLAEVLRGMVPPLREEPEFRSGLAGAPEPGSAAVHFDLPRLADIVRRNGGQIAEGIGEIDWDEVNEEIRQRFPQGLSEEQKRAEQDRYLERNKSRVRAIRVNVDYASAHLANARSLSLRTTPLPELPGYRLELRVKIEPGTGR
ncbi:MAG: hypothetical protein L0216_09035 [Planctomycetales bacterium]|nr:hypothetical protein [Planctomycetales bacterium]